MIIIDTREQWKEQIQQKLQSLRVSAHIMMLDNYCDYLLTSDNEEVEQSIGIQRKTINEVLQQMQEIQERIVELIAKYENAWLLVEEEDLFINADGAIMSKRGKLLYETGMSAKSYYNFLHSILKKGVQVKTTRNWEYSVWWLYSLHSYIQREHFPIPNKKYTQREEMIGALMGIKGIGEAKARQIYDLSEEKPSANSEIPIDGTFIVTRDIQIKTIPPLLEELTQEEMDAMVKEMEEDETI